MHDIQNPPFGVPVNLPTGAYAMWKNGHTFVTATFPGCPTGYVRAATVGAVETAGGSGYLLAAFGDTFASESAYRSALDDLATQVHRTWGG
jgi:hypothetical protein